MNKPEILFTRQGKPDNLKATLKGTGITPSPTKKPPETSLKSLAHTIWSGKKLISILSLCLFLIASSFYSSHFYSLSGSQSHTIQLQFTFPGAEKGLYPNDTQFNLSDIISAQVLEPIYKKYPQINQSLSLQAFMGNFIIHPAAIKRSAIEAKYRNKLEAESLSQTEISTLENAYKTELSTSSQRSAYLSYQSHTSESIKPHLIEKILLEIPFSWSRLAINQNGVLDLPITNTLSMDLNKLNNEEYTLGLALIQDYIEQLKNSLSILNRSHNAELIQDPETGLNLRSLNNQLERFESYQLNTLDKLVTNQHAFKDLKSTKAFLLSRLESLQDRLHNTLSKAQIYKIAYQEHTQLSGRHRAYFRPVSGTSTELGDAFISQLVKLGKKISESEYRQQLTSMEIALTLKAEDLKTEITLVKRKLSGINEHSENSLTPENINNLYLKATNKFIEISKRYTRLADIAKHHKLPEGNSLFELIENKVSTTSMNLIQFQRTAMAGFVALLIGVMLGVLIVLGRGIVVGRRLSRSPTV